MADRKVKLVNVVVLSLIVAVVLSCYVPTRYWRVMELPKPVKLEMGVLGPVHYYVPEMVLYIDGACQVKDEGGSVVTNLDVIRGGKVTIWNTSDALATIYFGDAFAPPGPVTLQPEYGVWRRVAREASDFNVTVTCQEIGEHTMVGYAQPDTIVTPPPNP